MRWGMVFFTAVFGCTSTPSPPTAAVADAASVLLQTSTDDSPNRAPTFRKLRIDTDPDGASIKEDGVEECSSTPCEMTYKGPDADPTRDHKLLISKTGYKVEARTIKIGDSPLSVKLTRAPVRWAPAPMGAKQSDAGTHRTIDDMGDYGSAPDLHY
jgi:hypothetical protein